MRLYFSLLTLLYLFHRELNLIQGVWIVLITKRLRQEIQLTPRADDLIAILINPLCDGIICLANGSKWAMVNNTGHLLIPRQIIDLDAFGRSQSSGDWHTHFNIPITFLKLTI